jgi:hypothetical protein
MFNMKKVRELEMVIERNEKTINIIVGRAKRHRDIRELAEEDNRNLFCDLMEARKVIKHLKAKISARRSISELIDSMSGDDCSGVPKCATEMTVNTGMDILPWLNDIVSSVDGSPNLAGVKVGEIPNVTYTKYKGKNPLPEVKRVFCGKTETVVLFTDGDKVVVRKSKGVKDDRQTAIAYAFLRKCTGKSKSQVRRWMGKLLAESK